MLQPEAFRSQRCADAASVYLLPRALGEDSVQEREIQSGVSTTAPDEARHTFPRMKMARDRRSLWSLYKEIGPNQDPRTSPGRLLAAWVIMGFSKWCTLAPLFGPGNGP